MRVRYKNTRRLPVVQMFVNNALEYMNIFDLEHTDLNIRFVDKLDGGYSHGHALAYTTLIAHKYNNSKFYKRFKELVTYFSFPKINLSTELEICAEIIFQDKKHLNNNPKIISKENIIDLLKIINITDISTKN